MDDPALVIDALERAPAIIVNLIREVPPAIMKRRPFPTKWSAHEHACHLTLADRLYSTRLDQFLAEPTPIITPYDPGRNDPDGSLLRLNLDDSVQDYAESRRRLVVRLRQLTPEMWQRTAEHGEYSHYSVLIMFRHLAFHDFFHAYRIEELLLRKEWTEEWQAFAARQWTLIRPESPEMWTAARQLIEEYAASLNQDLGFQVFTREIESLAVEYGPPDGCFLLAEEDGVLVGCGGLRRFSDTDCEMKRLYVVPAYRARGIGRLLAEALISEAKSIGYQTMLLDTLPSMKRAHDLYLSLGFTPAAPYRFNPLPGATFFQLQLTDREPL